MVQIHRFCELSINVEMVLEYNSQKPLSTSNGFGVQLTETDPYFFNSWKPSNTSNSFGLQLT